MSQPWLEQLRSLLDAPSPAVLQTYRKDGSAAVSPVWFRFTGEAFEVVVTLHDVKARRLRRDPRATLLIFESSPPFRGIELRVVELSDQDVTQARRSISSRYLGTEAAERFVAARDPHALLLRFPADEARVWALG